jgi:hypothetical protein
MRKAAGSGSRAIRKCGAVLAVLLALAFASLAGIFFFRAPGSDGYSCGTFWSPTERASQFEFISKCDAFHSDLTKADVLATVLTLAAGGAAWSLWPRKRRP